MPSNPQIAYRSEWKGWGDWLGTGNTKNSFLPFAEARSIVRGLKFPTRAAFYSTARARLLPPGVTKGPLCRISQVGLARLERLAWDVTSKHHRKKA
ncbi:MAG: hypothetical protein ACR2GC_01010 [Methyloceanibacter sp.]|uniref:hypothetical protein n=1 Tax=Methyloceanibacter sp. TaxID=1965321 RepID=UPI003D9AEC79